MKTAVLALTMWVITVAGACADLIMVQRVDGAGQAGEQTIKIKGDKARADLTNAISMITDGATGEMTTLMHRDRSFLKVSPEQTRAMMEQLDKLRSGDGPPPLTPSGKKEKIGAFECELYTVALNDLKITYWLAPAFPNYASILAQLDAFQSGAISTMGRGLMPEMKNFPGMVMKTQIETDGKKIISTLVSAKEDAVDPAVFKIPGNYKEITSPTLDFQPSKK